MDIMLWCIVCIICNFRVPCERERFSSAAAAAAAAAAAEPCEELIPAAVPAPAAPAPVPAPVLDRGPPGVEGVAEEAAEPGEPTAKPAELRPEFDAEVVGLMQTPLT